MLAEYLNLCLQYFMETKLAKKRGPKPSGEERVVYYRRVHPKWPDRLDSFMRAGDIKEGNADNPTYSNDGTTILSAAVYGSEVVPVESGIAGLLAQERKEKLALLDDVDRLTKEVEYWKGRFEKSVVATEHQMAVYWRDRALKAEKRAGELENQ